MSILSRCLVLAIAAGAASQSLAADPAAEKPRTETVALRVGVDAQGKVQTSKPSDPNAAPGLVSAAEAYARKLTFTPARKNGVPVSSETTLTTVLELQPRPGGQFSLRLKRATNGPGVLEVGKTNAPKYQQGKENGALVVVSAALLADGTVDMGSLTTERMELRVPSEFAEARYLDAIRVSLRGSRFELDKVDGVAIPERISVPYRFGGGPTRIKPGDEKQGRGQQVPEEIELPSLNAVSSVPGIELPKVDYRAPAAAPAAAAAPEPAK